MMQLNMKKLLFTAQYYSDYEENRMMMNTDYDT